MNATKNDYRWAILIILSIYLTLIYLNLNTGHAWGDDFASYIMQAASILNLSIPDFIIHNTFTITQSSQFPGPIAYPWGYPLLLSPIYWIFGLNPIALKAVNIFCYILFIVCINQLFKNRLKSCERIILVAFLAFNPGMIEFHNEILSDIPFLLFSTFSMLLIDRIVISKQKFISKRIDSILLGLIIFCAYSIRENGILLLITLFICQGLIIYDLRKTNPNSVKSSVSQMIVPFLIFLILLIIYSNLFIRGDSSYLLQFNRISPLLVIKHIYLYALLPSTFFHNLPDWSIINHFLSICLWLLVLVGIGKKWIRDYHFVLYSGLTLFLYIVWPPLQGLRFVFPVLPFYLYFIFIGVKTIISRLQKQKLIQNENIPIYIYLAIVILFLWTSSTKGLNNLKNHRQVTGPFDPISSEMFQYITNQTDQDAVIVFYKPRAMRLITGRDSFTTNDCLLYPKADYIVSYHVINRELTTPLKNLKCDQIINTRPVFRNENYDVFYIETK